MYNWIKENPLKTAGIAIGGLIVLGLSAGAVVSYNSDARVMLRASEKKRKEETNSIRREKSLEERKALAKLDRSTNEAELAFYRRLEEATNEYEDEIDEIRIELERSTREI